MTVPSPCMIAFVHPLLQSQWQIRFDAVIAQLEKPEDEEEREKERVLEDQEWDILDYNYLAINAAANGGKLQIIAPNRDNSDIRAKKEAEWHEEVKTTADGRTYKVRFKKDGRMFAEHKAKELSDYLNDGESRRKEVVEEFQATQKQKEKDELWSAANKAIGVQRWQPKDLLLKH